MAHPIIEIENFDIETELKCRCGCGRYNYDTEFLIRVQAYRYLVNTPLTVTGGGRCIEHNKKEGGQDNSCHQCETKKATAIDITGKNLAKLYQTACNCGLFNEVIWYVKKNFIHLALDRNQVGNYFTKV